MGWEEDGTTMIFFDVIGLIRCGACDRQGDVFLRFQLRGINRLYPWKIGL